jgi:Ca2+-binding RTX toxin-like protein
LVGRRTANSLHGSVGNDRLKGRSGNDHLGGGAGDDVLRGGRGIDFFDGWVGSDTVMSRDGESERVDCGPDFDRVTADSVDTLIDCEAVGTE